MKHSSQYTSFLITQLLNYLITNSIPALVLLLPMIVEACPGCKDALVEPGQLSQRLAMAKGDAVSIILFLSVPMTLVGGIAWSIACAQRRKPGPPAGDIDTPPLSG